MKIVILVHSPKGLLDVYWWGLATHRKSKDSGLIYWHKKKLYDVYAKYFGVYSHPHMFHIIKSL